jgi:hypothetical protein
MRVKIILFLIITHICANSPTVSLEGAQYYTDQPFVQDYAIKIPLSSDLKNAILRKVRTDRNGRILVLSNQGLLQVHKEKLVRDRQYRPLADMQIRDIDIYQNQFVYLTDHAVLSNAWAGKFHITHEIPQATQFQMGNQFDFLIAEDTSNIVYYNGKEFQKYSGETKIKKLAFDATRNRYLLLDDNKIQLFTPERGLQKVYDGKNLNCLMLSENNSKIILGTKAGYLILDANSFRSILPLQTKLPWPDIRCINKIGAKLWCGTPKGVFAIHPNGSIDFYASQRWLLDDDVIDIAPGPEQSVLILSTKGLSIIRFEKMTLAQKAKHFDQLTRQRHIRYGFNSAITMGTPGDFSTGTLIDQDNDGLWTAMYLAGELFRYSVTKSEEALQNCYESFGAMERLESINPLEGFPARSFDRSGYQVADTSRWQIAPDPRWTWKATTSSDEIVGHFFVYSIFAEIVSDKNRRDRCITLMDGIMNHIVKNNWYLIDYDGKPTLWGRWHPEYVNQFPVQVGDRRLNSVEIIAFLQTAYHFTGKELYKQKAYELFEKHGYLDNIMIPITTIGLIPGIDLTTEWNHSDDELAFLSYWNLYRYAFTKELREKYRQAIKEHWEIERPEKNPLWNFIYAMTGAEEFDLQESIWFLQEFPLDMVSWTVKNSQRQDLEFLKSNFRDQYTKQVLPPDERPMTKFNNNAFRLDGGNGGFREYSGDIYLLPYWMGRYLKMIR